VKTKTRSVLTLTLALGCAPSAHGQEEILADPMRPATHSPAAAADAAPAESGVQVILTSPQRKLAVIDGKVVRLGGDVREGTLVGLSDAGAVLKKNGGRDVLLLHPGIDKRPARKLAP
jgi:MSHA biogenesis protein MshK